MEYGSGLGPNGSCRLDYYPELTLLVLWGDAIANDRCGEAALRAQSEAFERHKPAGFVDPRDQVLGPFPSWCLGRDQSQHHDLVVRDRLQRLKRSRALVIVLEQESLCANLLKNRLGYEIVAALGQPPAALIPPSEVKAEGHLRESADDRVVELDPLL